ILASCLAQTNCDTGPLLIVGADSFGSLEVKTTYPALYKPLRMRTTARQFCNISCFADHFPIIPFTRTGTYLSQHSIHERRRRGLPHPLHKLDGFVDGGPRRNAIQKS